MALELLQVDTIWLTM